MPAQRTKRDRIEPKIELAVKQNVSRLNATYRRAAVIHRMAAGERAGTVDLMILPGQAGPHRLVLVEAKRFNTTEASTKIVGQLLRYHAAAQKFGDKGLALLRAYARRRPVPAPARVSAQRVCSPTSKLAVDRATAWQRLCAGTPLAPGDIALFLALNGPPKRRLCDRLDELYRTGGPEVGVVVTDVGAKPSRVLAVGRPSDPGGLAEFRSALEGWERAEIPRKRSSG